ncbi:MAG TPA: YbhB/YbcL family Raf kinase inhibitor-like protein, partial [Terriglobia bacterium]
MAHVCESTHPSSLIDHSVGFMLRVLVLLVLLFAVPFLAGCRSSDPPPTRSAASAAITGAITLSSDSLAAGTIPKVLTCDGADQSPQLRWTAPPPETKSLVLTVTDPDAPSGTFTHWVLFNLPPTSSDIPAGIPTQNQLTDGSRQGRNDFGKIGYGGPCPPRGTTHRYFFDLFALNATLDL